MLVEPSRRVVDSMDEHGAGTDGVGGGGGAPQRVLEEGLSETLALFAPVDSEARQQDDPDGMPGKPFSDSGRSLFRPHAAGGERVVADHRADSMHNEGLGRIVLLIDQRESFQPYSQGFRPAIEALDVVPLGELLDRGQRAGGRARPIRHYSRSSR